MMQRNKRVAGNAEAALLPYIAPSDAELRIGGLAQEVRKLGDVRGGAELAL